MTPPAPLANSSTLYALPALPAPKSWAKIGIADCSEAPTKNDAEPGQDDHLTSMWFRADLAQHPEGVDSADPRPRRTPSSRVCPVYWYGTGTASAAGRSRR